jgi:hypothetical protein
MLKKLNYFQKNKAAIDSLLLLTSTACIADYITLKNNFGNDYWSKVSANEITIHFFDTAGNLKNPYWVNYKTGRPGKAQELRAVILKMIDLTNNMIIPSRENAEEHDISFFKNTICIPLKPVKRENEDGTIEFSCIVVYEKAKISADSVKSLYKFRNLRPIGNNVLTDVIEK